MKRFIRLISVFVITSMLFPFNTPLNVSASNSDLIDLQFTIDMAKYISKGIQKEIDVAPFIENESTLVPFRVIFEELGYTINWDDSTSSIVAKKGNNTITLQINNNAATINGKTKEMTIAPKIVGGRTVVPLRFVSENSGANVKWNDQTRSVQITKVGSFDTGKIMFYEKTGDNNNKVNIYDGTKFDEILLEQQEIVKWYSFKGQILALIYDITKNKHNFTILKNGKFNVLISDFDIKDTFEYNNSLLIQGYDRDQKKNYLFRFDGSSLTKIKDDKAIEDDFFIGKYIVFKDKLLINKYDNLRNYTLLAFDQNSWTPSALANEFILTDSIEHEGILYITGKIQDGNTTPFLSYDGNGISQTNLKIISESASVSLSNIFLYKENLYVQVDGYYKNFKNGGVKDFILSDGTDYMKYTVKDIKLFKDKQDKERLFFEITEGIYTDSSGVPLPEQPPIEEPDITDDPNSTSSDPNTYDPNTYDPNTYDPNTYDPNTYDPNTYDPNTQSSIYKLNVLTSSVSIPRFAISSVLASNTPITAQSSADKNPIYPYVFEIEDITDNGVVNVGKIKKLSYDIKKIGESNTTKKVLDNFELASEMKVEDGKLLLTGMLDNQNILFIVDSDTVIRVLDVLEIRKTVTVGDKLFIDVNDYNRMKNTQRNTIIMYSNKQVKNIVSGIDTQYLRGIKDTMIIYGTNQDSSTNNLYSYDTANPKFTQLLSDIEITYINDLQNGTIVNTSSIVQAENTNTTNSIKSNDTNNTDDLNDINNEIPEEIIQENLQDTTLYSLYMLTDSGKQLIKDNLSVSKMIKVKGTSYLVYAQDSSIGKNVLYVFDENKKSLLPIKMDMNISDMIFMN